MLFEQRGYDEVTVADVARSGLFSEQTICNYFATKRRSPASKRMTDCADPKYTSVFAVRTVTEVQPWSTRRVSLLGGAVHNMTPLPRDGLERRPF
jgi:2-polyprenyl-6-methoxyphenol hydroxylase-like FAD-dependent oxidoreductase